MKKQFEFRAGTDVLESRSDARALRDHMKQRGWNAQVERSGPKGKAEFRVLLKRNGMTAYVHSEDNLKDQNWQPNWIGAKAAAA